MTKDRIDPDILKNLERAIEALQEDVQKVEIWAGALSAFARPVPAYDPQDDFLLPSSPRARTNGRPQD